MTRTNRFPMPALVMCCGVLALGSTAWAQDQKLGHFKCYITRGEPADERVLTQDQFDIADKAEWDTTFVRQAVRFCNPVDKIHRRTLFHVPDPRAHLTLYITTSDDLAATRSVTIANQFGKARLLTFDAPILAVPTMKNTEGFSEELDHYKCYRAYGRSANAVVTLRDQFTVEQNVKVGSPILFCNPSRKIHPATGGTFGVQNARDHLACYLIERRPFNRGLVATDQFGRHELAVREADILCAPTFKLEWHRLE